MHSACSLPYTYESRLITLSIHSSLEAVGFIAVISRTLAQAGIPCNAIAGYCHDHVFVPVDRAEEAMTLLNGIAARSQVIAWSDVTRQRQCP